MRRTTPESQEFNDVGTLLRGFALLPHGRFWSRLFEQFPHPLTDFFHGKTRMWIIHRGLKRALQTLFSEIGVRFQFLVLAKDDKDRFAGIGEHATRDKIEDPFGKAGWQINFEAQTAFARLLTQGLGLCEVACPILSGSPVVLLIFGHEFILHLDRQKKQRPDARERQRLKAVFS